jgi:tRNA pseudouridine55 synthase
MADGVLNLLKPPGMTSHDVVSLVRRALQTKKVGHTGTLDPGVAGVLPICVGKATRLADYIMGADKAYRAEITFGVETETADSFGAVTAERSAAHLGRGDVAYVLPRFTGEIMQIPPMVSAVKVGGKRLYEFARAGQEIERQPRPVTIHRLQLLDFTPGRHPVAVVDVVCSKGTYIRTLADDLGRALGVGAHMSHLVRTRSGPFHLAETTTVEELLAGEYRLMPPSEALGSMARLTVTGRPAERIAHGVAPTMPVAHPDGTTVALLDATGDLLALAEVANGHLKLKKVFTKEE